MRFTSPDRPANRALYHAVSSYQLLEVLLHRIVRYPHSRAVLILPDFITQKYPKYKRLLRGRFFDELYLLPYLHISHTDERTIAAAVARWYDQNIPHALEDFGAVYIAGAHFYFSLLPISRSIPFVFLEDAAGMLSRPQDLYLPLARRYPVHAAIAREYGLFDGTNPLVSGRVCLRRAQAEGFCTDGTEDFCVEDILQALPDAQRKRIIRLFLRRRIRTHAQAILLTQRFAGLGLMGETEQRALYRRAAACELRDLRLVIKPHPDDTLDYREIFPRAQILAQKFPSELLPYVFTRRPEQIYTFDSTGCENLRDHFQIRRMERMNPE